MDFRQEIAAAIAGCVEMQTEEILGMLEVPPNTEMGDYAFPCFRLAKTLRKAPPMIAAELSQKLVKPECVSRVETAGGYLNFYLDQSNFAHNVLTRVLAEGERYGGSDLGQGKTVCIDYSSINIAKPFHIGHLSTTVIGAALYRIYSFLGYKCVGINHLGDWGTQFGKLIVAYQRWSSREEIEREGISGLLKIYVRFHDEAEKDSALEDEARMWFKKIEDGDAQATELFEWFKELTLKEVSRVYDMLNIKFDSYAGESFYNDKMGRVIDELRDKNLLVESQGAYVVDLEAYSLPPCLLLKSDGATLYATRDIAAALYRKDTYDFYKCLYVVAYQQNLHFQQFFKVIEMMGYEWAKDLEHVAFGMVSMEDGAMSTRKGKVVMLEDLLRRAIEKTSDIIAEKSATLENKEQVARDVGVGAVVFSALFSGRIKDIVFSWERALNFDGESGPYVQYTHARCCSVLAKAPTRGDWQGDELTDPYAQEVLRLLDAFPLVVKESCERNEPSMTTRHIADLAKAYNKFYYENRIIDDNESVRNARLALTEATRTVIKTGLGLLGIVAVEKM